MSNTPTLTGTRPRLADLPGQCAKAPLHQFRDAVNRGLGDLAYAYPRTGFYTNAFVVQACVHCGALKVGACPDPLGPDGERGGMGDRLGFILPPEAAEYAVP